MVSDTVEVSTAGTIVIIHVGKIFKLEIEHVILFNAFTKKSNIATDQEAYSIR